MRQRVWLFIPFVIIFTLFLSCSVEQGGVKTSIQSQDDADDCAVIISSTWNEPIYAGSSSHTYSNEREDGFEKGYAISNGTYYYNYVYPTRTRRYTNVTVQFYDYADDADFSSMTGTITVHGTLSYSESTQYYSGGWTVTGTIDLSPPTNTDFDSWKFQCTVTFNFYYVSPWDYYGTITSSGDVYNVDSIF